MNRFYDVFGERLIGPGMLCAASVNAAAKIMECQTPISMIVCKMYRKIYGRMWPLDPLVGFRMAENIRKLEITLFINHGFAELNQPNPCTFLLNFFQSHENISPSVQQTSVYLCLIMLHFTLFSVHHTPEEIAATGLLLAARIFAYEEDLAGLLKNGEDDEYEGQWWRSLSPDIQYEKISSMADKFLEIRSRVNKSVLYRLRQLLSSRLLYSQAYEGISKLQL